MPSSGLKICNVEKKAQVFLAGMDLREREKVTEQTITTMKRRAREDASFHKDFDPDFEYGEGPAQPVRC